MALFSGVSACGDQRDEKPEAPAMALPAWLRGVAVLLATAAFLCLGLSASAEQRLLTVLVTSDFHGSLYPSEDSSVEDSSAGRMLGGAGVLATYIHSWVIRNPQGTLLVDDGDLMSQDLRIIPQSPPISPLFHGQPVIDLYNYLGYDAAAVGNHEFEWGEEVLSERAKQAKFPFLAANVVDRDFGDPPVWAKPYVLKDVNGIKVGLLGISNPTVIPAKATGLEFLDPVETINSLVPVMRKKGAQIIVVLAHLGGRQAGDGAISGDIADLAKRVRGVDLLLGGHSHTRVCGQVGGVPVVIPGCWGQVLGVVDLTYDSDDQKVVNVRCQLVKTFSDEVAPDATASALVKAYEDKAAQYEDKAAR